MCQYSVIRQDSKFGLRRMSQCGSTFNSMCQYTVTGQDSKFDLQLMSQCGSTFNCSNRFMLEVRIVC